MNGLWELVKRDLVRFVRQPTRVAAALGTAALMWLVLGSGFAGSFVGDVGRGSIKALGYSAYLTPGMAGMIVVFSSIFAAIGLIEDRQEGFLQAVLVSPAKLRTTLGARLISGAIVGVGQGLLIVAAGALAGLEIGGWTLPASAAALACMSVGIGGIGLALAWRINSVAGFHGVMNLILMPMWLLSGAFFPLERAAGWLAWIMRFNPMTWATAALRAALQGDVASGGWNWLGAALLAAGGIAAAGWAMRSRAA